MEEIRIAINNEIQKLKYYRNSNLERNKTERVNQLNSDLRLLRKIKTLLSKNENRTTKKTLSDIRSDKR